MIATVLHADDIELTKITTPILPFRLGESKILSTKHTFIHYVELAPLTNQLNSIEQYFIIINNTINNHNVPNYIYKTALISLLTHTNHLIDITKVKLNNLTPHLRTKRGLLNIIGKASKWLFGTLDADDATKYDEALRILQDNQNSVIQQNKLQVSLTKNLIDSYNKTITTLDHNQRHIELRLEYLQKNTKTLSDEVSSFVYAQNVLDQIILNCQNVIRFADNIENAIMFAKLNVLHNSVIPLVELKNMIDNLIKIYGEDKIPKFKNDLSYYQIASLQVSFQNNKIIFAVHLPILSSENYDYFHLYPVPKNNLTIVPELPYLILGTEKYQYQETECPVVEDIYMCPNRIEPIEDDCVINLIRKAADDHCQTTPIHMKYPLSEQISNQYVLIVPTSNSITIQKDCSSNGYITIHEPTLIKLPKNCSIQIGHLLYTSHEEMVQGEPFILPEIVTASQKPKNQLNKPLHLKHINLDAIVALQNQAESLQVQEFPQTISTMTHVSLSLALGTFIIIASAAALYYIWRRRHRPQRQQKLSTKSPAPETKPSVLFSDLRREELRVT